MIYLAGLGDIRPEKAKLQGVSLIRFKSPDGLLLNAWYHPPKPHLPTIVYFHGNAGHLSDRANAILPYIHAGFGVLLVGYRGYDDNPGAPSEAGLYQDARGAMDYLQSQHISAQCLVLYGESLGSAVAIQMATEYPVGAVVLQSPFTSLVDVGKKHYYFLPVRWLLLDRYESDKKIQSIHAPLLVLHGQRDRVVPVTLGIKLYNAALPPKKIKIYPNTGHQFFPDRSEEVIAFAKKWVNCKKAIS